MAMTVGLMLKMSGSYYNSWDIIISYGAEAESDDRNGADDHNDSVEIKVYVNQDSHW